MPIFNLSERRRQRAERLHEQAMQLSDTGRGDEAIEKYLEALKLDPRRPNSLYNIGLIYKYRKEWQKSLEYNQRACALDPHDEGSIWNLAIAATALRRWDLARQAWTAAGIKLEGDQGPIEMNFGLTPVRLDPGGDGEVVWARRIDPARARIDNVPLPASGFRRGDIVLHDGAPVGHRRLDGRDYPVFNVLELFERSDQRTFRAVVEASGQAVVDELERRAAQLGIEVEDWTGSVRILCRQCSEGTPHARHDEELTGRDWASRRDLGISASKLDDVRKLLDEWAGASGAKLLSLVCELEP